MAAELSALIRTNDGKPGVEKTYPLTLGQARATIGRDTEKMRGQLPVPAVMWLCLEIEGVLDVAALRQTLQAIVTRHLALRVQIVPNPGISDIERAQRLSDYIRTGVPASDLYVQVVAYPREPSLAIYNAEPCDSDHLVKNLLGSEIATPFDDDSPLRLRATLVRESETRHVLIIALDHRMSDGGSLRILQREVQQLYEHHAYGGAPVAEPRASYVEFAEQQHLACISSELDADLDYWEGHWREFSDARLRPLDIPFAELSAQSSATFATQRMSVREADTSAFRSAAKRFRVTPYVFFLGAFLTVLRLYVSRDKLALWAHCANRTSETVSSIGFYIHTHLMGFRVPADCTARELLAQVRCRHHDTIKHQRMPLPLLWRTLHCRPRFPDAGIMLDYLTEDPQPRSNTRQVTFRKLSVDIPHPGRIARISVVVMDHGRTFSIRSDHIESLYPADAVEMMLQDMIHVARTFSEDLDCPISSFAEIEGRYSSRPRLLGSEMGEFVVTDSAHIPSRKPTTGVSMEP